MCGQYNVRATARNNTGQNIDKGTPSPRLEVGDSFRHATAMEYYIGYCIL